MLEKALRSILAPSPVNAATLGADHNPCVTDHMKALPVNEEGASNRQRVFTDRLADLAEQSVPEEEQV